MSRRAGRAPRVLRASSASTASAAIRRGATRAAASRQRRRPSTPAPSRRGTGERRRSHAVATATRWRIRDDIGDCTRCKLHTLGRTQIVFGVGNPKARSDVRRRGAGRGRRHPGRAVRRPRRAAADEDHRGDRPDARAGLHRQRHQVPAAGQPQSRAGRSGDVRAVPVPADRRRSSRR